MQEKIYCLACKKKRWAEVTMIELHPGEYKIEGYCKKCRTPIIKIIKVPPQESNKIWKA